MHRTLVLSSCIACCLLGCPDVDSFTVEELGGSDRDAFAPSATTSNSAQPDNAQMSSTAVEESDDGTAMGGEENLIGGGGGAPASVGGSMNGGAEPQTSGGELGSDSSGGQTAASNDPGDAGGASAPGGDDEPSSSCTIAFQVTLPSDTPAADSIYMAGSFFDDVDLDWMPNEKAMERSGAMATIELILNRGQTLQYKYTRGTWDNAEATADCQPRPNRNILVSCTSNERSDVIERWSDAQDCR